MVIAVRESYWTKDRQYRAVKLAKAGETTSIIAQILGGGCTKNMVIGFLSRAGTPIMSKYKIAERNALATAAHAEAVAERAIAANNAAITKNPAKMRQAGVMRRAEIAKRATAKREAALAKAEAAKIQQERVSTDPEADRPFVSIFDRLPDIAMTGCRWISGEVPGQWSFCNAKPSEPGGSWCAEHRARVFSKTPLLRL